ncbi:EAL domain-containing protein [Acidocella sp. MX-AZ02]|uniref:bifunctional diguanylate cyclase/phosphodiesterase n=1 Tax=Acidocella sp. MX-AZ02 TaxID=1214225 RepID=UPI00028CE2E2|nr:EAL domain-containing protein [Acidocella sp. MX-AZ02]EKM98209.1 PAS/PAC sensor-containing diguanylate cyclase/phosphodiesterase [Acidocella sp. MX-AZ02]
MSIIAWAWILLAIAIGFGSCLCAAFLVARARTKGAGKCSFWLGLAVLIFGSGVWTTHFVAMMAQEPDMEMGYALLPTVLSAACAIFGAAPAFALVLAPNPVIFRRVASGAILGGSVAAMHFTGMAAMRFDGRLDYQPGCVILAITLGMILSTLAWRRVDALSCAGAVVETGIFLVLGIAAIHFIAMAGTRYLPGTEPAVGGILIGRNATLTSAAACAMVIGLASVIAVFDQRWRWVRQEAARLREVADCTIEGLLIHADGVILWANNVLCHMLESSAEGLAGRDVAEIVAPKCRNTLRPHLFAEVHSIDEIEIAVESSRILCVEIASRAIRYEGKPAGVIALRDITERRKAEARIEHLAFNDALTGLSNRVRFDEVLAKTIQSTVTARPAYLLMIDLDRFKAVNDLHGHPIGDRVLQHVASRLQRLVRQEDLVARLGGDEFAILLPNTTAEAAIGLAERIIETLSRPVEVNGLILMIGASVGLASAPINASRSASLMQASDFALGRAKREGRNRYCFFEVGMDVRFRERQAIEQDLRHAIEARTLDVHYQPLVDCVTRRIVGYEALVRWHHLERGWISPAEFIPIAEDSGLIMPLGQMVLECSVATARDWPKDVVLAVNLSPRQFCNPNLPEDIIATITRLGLPAEQLELEITESVLIDDSSRALAMLRQLKAHGIRIALDDFGTGYSSLGTLRQFPFDKMKIDRSFVQNLGIDADATSMVHAILAMGNSLHLAVTAEGVETQIQLDALYAAGCSVVQGFLLGRPAPSPLPFVSANELLPSRHS